MSIQSQPPAPAGPVSVWTVPVSATTLTDPLPVLTVPSPAPVDHDLAAEMAVLTRVLLGAAAHLEPAVVPPAAPVAIPSLAPESSFQPEEPEPVLPELGLVADEVPVRVSLLAELAFLDD